MKFLYSIFLIIFSFEAHSSLASSLANPNAKKGGTYTYNIGSEPTTLNPLSAVGYYSGLVTSLAIESMANRNIETYEWEGRLAQSWEISKDRKTFIFNLREGITWQDGKPFTANDVKFTFDAITDPNNRYKTAARRPYYDGIDRAEVLSSHKIKFIAKSSYFRNFDSVAGMGIVAEHLHRDISKKNIRKLKKNLIGTGPYRFKRLRKGKYVEMVENKNWWGRKDPSFKGMRNFAKIRLRFIRDREMAIRRMERGELDFIDLSAEEYYRKTNGPKWGKEVHRVKFQGGADYSYNYIGMNLKNKIFKDKRVRRALYHLLDREKMIEKFRYNSSVPATGPWHVNNPYADSKVKPILYNPKRARAILKRAGWKDSDGDKILDKTIGGRKVKLSFSILETRAEFLRYLTIFKEDAKKEGIDINIKQTDWNTFIKLLEEKKFDAVRLGWSGGSVDIDPKQIWHSSSTRSGGSNFISYQNKKVDALIDKARNIHDSKKRMVILKKAYREIAAEIPYLFLFNDTVSFYAHRNRIKRVRDSYRYGVGHLTYWWIE